MNPSPKPLVRAAALVAAGALLWWWAAAAAEPVPPPVAPAPLVLSWRADAVQRYHVVLDSLVQVGGNPNGAEAPIHQQVQGELALRTLTVAPDGVLVGLQLEPVVMRVGGVADAEVARELGQPFRVVFTTDGMPRTFEFPRDVPPRTRALLAEIVRTFQVVVRAAPAWEVEEEHGTGRYVARYEREDTARLRRSKLRYVAAAGTGGAVVTVRRASADVRLAAHVDWLAGMVVDEELAARDGTGTSFVVTTHAELALLPAAADAATAPLAAATWSFATGEAITQPAALRLVDLPEADLVASIAALLAQLDAAGEGRTVWVHRVRDLLRADDRAAALLLDQLQRQTVADRTRADVFLACELAATPAAQAGLVRVAQTADRVSRDRTRALIALGGLEQPTAATMAALWQVVRERGGAPTPEFADTALLALGALGSRMPHASDAGYATLRDGLLAEAWGAAAPGERAVAVLALANTGDRELGPQLQPFLDDGAADVRRAAAKAMGRLGGEAGVAELALRLPNEANSAVRAAMAAGCAAQAKPAPEVQAVARQLVRREPDEATRLELARCLGRDLAGHADNEAALRTLLAAETSPAIRRYVGEVLGRAADARDPAPR